MGDYSALSRQTQWSHRGREIRERGDDAKTEGTKAVWPRSRESKAASRCWRRQGRDAPESTSSDDVFTLAQEDSFPTPDLQNHKRISSCCFNHFICGNLLQELQEMKTDSNPTVPAHSRGFVFLGRFAHACLFCRVLPCFVPCPPGSEA